MVIENCNANYKFIPTTTGGDGSEVPCWFVGYDPVLSAVIVSHEGPDAINL
jgi:inorganic pyrophosphatase